MHHPLSPLIMSFLCSTSQQKKRLITYPTKQNNPSLSTCLKWKVWPMRVNTGWRNASEVFITPSQRTFLLANQQREDLAAWVFAVLTTHSDATKMAERAFPVPISRAKSSGEKAADITRPYPCKSREHRKKKLPAGQPWSLACQRWTKLKKKKYLLWCSSSINIKSDVGNGQIVSG